MVLETIELLRKLESHYQNGGWEPGVHDQMCVTGRKGCLVGQGTRIETGYVLGTEILSKESDLAPATAAAMIEMCQDPEVVAFWARHATHAEGANRLRSAEFYNDHVQSVCKLEPEDALGLILALIRRTIARLEEFEAGPRILTEEETPPLPEEQPDVDGEDQPEEEPVQGVAVPI